MAISNLSTSIYDIQSLQGKIKDIAAQKFALGDKDEDGKFSLEEYSALQQNGAYKTAKIAGGASAAEIFSQIDSDKDGAVSRDEFINSRGEGVVTGSSITLGNPEKAADKFSPDGFTALLTAQEEARFDTALSLISSKGDRKENSASQLVDGLLKNINTESDRKA